MNRAEGRFSAAVLPRIWPWLCDPFASSRTVFVEDVLIASFVNAFRHGTSPTPSIQVARRGARDSYRRRISQFEVPVLERQPRVDHFRDGDATASVSNHVRGR